MLRWSLLLAVILPVVSGFLSPAMAFSALGQDRLVLASGRTATDHHLAQADPRQPVISARDVVGPANRPTAGTVAAAPLPPLQPEPEPVAVGPAPVAAPPVAGEPAKPDPVVDAPPQRAARTVTKGGGTYVVIGSYKLEENARKVVGQHLDLSPSTRSVTVRGERYTRVVAGPFSPADAEAVKLRLKREKGISAFTAKSCAAKASRACIGPRGQES